MFPEPEKGGRGEKGSVTEQFSGVSRRALPARPRRPGRLRSILIRRFFYGVTLGQAEIPERIPYVRSPHKLLLSADEVVRFLEDFADGPWGQKIQSWRRNWSELIPFFAFPDEVRGSFTQQILS